MVTAAALLFACCGDLHLAAAKVPLPKPRPPEAPSAKAEPAAGPETECRAAGCNRASRLPLAGSP